MYDLYRSRRQSYAIINANYNYATMDADYNYAIMDANDDIKTSLTSDSS